MNGIKNNKMNSRSWNPLPGFRVSQCRNCGCIKRWDAGYKKIVYRTLEVESYEVARQPLSRPKLTSAVFRYFKDDIIVKSTKNNLLSHIYDEKLSSYPYTLLRNTLDEKFLICNSNSCFGEEKSFEEIKNFIGV